MALEDLVNGLKYIHGGFEVLWYVVAQGRQRNRGFFNGMIRGV